MSSLQLGYRDFEQLTQDTFDRSLLIEICEKFLEQDNVSEEAKLYAKAKLARHQAISNNEPNLDAIKLHQDLVDLAKRNSNVPLESLALVKLQCAGSAQFIIGDVKQQKFSEALGIALGVDFPDLDSAITAAKTTKIELDDPILVAFVASSVGIANELAENDLDKGYDILANVIKHTPDIMYPRVSAIYNRINKYLRDNDNNALEQAKVLKDEVSQFSALRLTEDTEFNTIHLRKQEAIRGFISELSEAIQRDVSRLELASLLEKPTKSPAEATLNRYRKAIKENKSRLV